MIMQKRRGVFIFVILGIVMTVGSLILVDRFLLSGFVVGSGASVAGSRAGCFEGYQCINPGVTGERHFYQNCLKTRRRGTSFDCAQGEVCYGEGYAGVCRVYGQRRTTSFPDLEDDYDVAPVVNAVCGNGVVEDWEDCDGGQDAICPGSCTPPGQALECTCQLPTSVDMRTEIVEDVMVGLTDYAMGAGALTLYSVSDLNDVISLDAHELRNAFEQIFVDYSEDIRAAKYVVSTSDGIFVFDSGYEAAIDSSDEDHVILTLSRRGILWWIGDLIGIVDSRDIDLGGYRDALDIGGVAGVAEDSLNSLDDSVVYVNTEDGSTEVISYAVVLSAIRELEDLGGAGLYEKKAALVRPFGAGSGINSGGNNGLGSDRDNSVVSVTPSNNNIFYFQDSKRQGLSNFVSIGLKNMADKIHSEYGYNVNSCFGNSCSAVEIARGILDSQTLVLDSEVSDEGSSELYCFEHLDYYNNWNACCNALRNVLKASKDVVLSSDLCGSDNYGDSVSASGLSILPSGEKGCSRTSQNTNRCQIYFDGSFWDDEKALVVSNSCKPLADSLYSVIDYVYGGTCSDESVQHFDSEVGLLTDDISGQSQIVEQGVLKHFEKRRVQTSVEERSEHGEYTALSIFGDPYREIELAPTVSDVALETDENNDLRVTVAFSGTLDETSLPSVQVDASSCGIPSGVSFVEQPGWVSDGIDRSKSNVGFTLDIDPSVSIFSKDMWKSASSQGQILPVNLYNGDIGPLPFLPFDCVQSFLINVGYYGSRGDSLYDDYLIADPYQLTSHPDGYPVYPLSQSTVSCDLPKDWPYKIVVRVSGSRGEGGIQLDGNSQGKLTSRSEKWIFSYDNARDSTMFIYRDAPNGDDFEFWIPCIPPLDVGACGVPVFEVLDYHWIQSDTVNARYDPTAIVGYSCVDSCDRRFCGRFNPFNSQWYPGIFRPGEQCLDSCVEIEQSVDHLLPFGEIGRKWTHYSWPVSTWDSRPTIPPSRTDVLDFDCPANSAQFPSYCIPSTSSVYAERCDVGGGSS